jgi:hypothetical protein
MQDSARFFAYSTWSVMVSVAIILFTHGLLDWVREPGWVGTAILLGFGFLYLNLCYAAIKRFIRKVPAPTNLHILLAFIIYLPPFIWILGAADTISTTEYLLWVVLAISCGLGAVYGNRAGIKARYEYIQALKEHQEKMAEQK